ncbi:uncharacterized protein PHALS_12345 [Plasmopara halstedii]|uniref:Uncharacterized protein n=1 Tax=Plasmopara halstedii TaxID=4781 RepID=A0A0P1ALJ9_PLAHL|nr:uncharacterized protein PHALS_12345 [Plasmopara halstedii]CEG42039.1 hypothetical protein PHALS_12345 [Plasmopara halstedii]|eukprot:XP_024578408.1 hypothetical protein PHALS_12345 [Plasmopara halstedii]
MSLGPASARTLLPASREGGYSKIKSTTHLVTWGVVIQIALQEEYSDNQAPTLSIGWQGHPSSVAPTTAYMQLLSF